MELYKRGTKTAVKLDTAKDRIAAYMIGQLEELHPEEHKMLERWSRVWTLLNNYHSPVQAVEAHLQHCKNTGEEISRATAFRDLRCATDIWGDATKISKRAMLVLIYEFALKSFQMAAKAKNITEMNKAIANLTKIAKETEDYFDDDFEGHTFVLELSLGSGEKKTINLDNLNEISKNDYYEIIEAVEQDEIDSMQMRKILTGGTDEEATASE